MAETGEKIRRKGLSLGRKLAPMSGADPITNKTFDLAEKADRKIQKKGGFIESTQAEAGREAKAAKKKQEEGILRQTQREELKLAEAESEISKRRLLRSTGGRRSLMAKR